MGVFVTGRQVALEIDMPGWWLANASVDMDFRRGLYYDSSTANPRAATDFLSCTRASVGYAKTNAGTLTSFASNALRITDLGLLVEDARTNVITQSGDFSHTDWTKHDVTVTANQAVAPDGTTTMDKIVDSAVNDRHVIEEFISLSAATTATASVFVKDIDRRYIQVNSVRTGIDYAYCYADLQTGTITAAGASGSFTYISSSIEAFANGVYRVTLVFIGDPVNANTNLDYGLSDRSTHTGSFNSGSPAYSGSGLGVYFWGAQVEVGSFSSSYIATTTASAGRAADAISCIGNLDTLLKASARTSVVDIIASATPVTWDIVSGSTAGNELVVSSSDTVITSNTTTKSFSGSGAFTTGVKVGAGTSGSATSVTGAGLTVATGASGVANTGTVYLGSDNTNYWYGYIRRATFWNSKIADATLQALTAP